MKTKVNTKKWIILIVMSILLVIAIATALYIFQINKYDNVETIMTDYDIKFNDSFEVGYLATHDLRKDEDLSKIDKVMICDYLKSLKKVEGKLVVPSDVVGMPPLIAIENGQSRIVIHLWSHQQVDILIRLKDAKENEKWVGVAYEATEKEHRYFLKHIYHLPYILEDYGL